MKSPILYLVFSLVLANCIVSDAQILYPSYDLLSNNPFFLTGNSIPENRIINHSGIKLSGYAFQPVYCDSQIVEQYNSQTQRLEILTTTKMQYDGLMRPILRKTYENLSFSSYDTTSLLFFYDTMGKITQIRTNSSQQVFYDYNVFGDLVLAQLFQRINNQWVLTHSDSNALTYQNNKLFSKVSYIKDPGVPNYFAHTRNLNLAFNSNNQLTQQFRQQTPWPYLNWPNDFKAEVNLEWEMGYPTKHWEIDNRPNYLGYLIALPNNWHELLPEPTKGEYYHVEGLNFTLEKRLKNEGWLNNKLIVYEDYSVGPNAHIDTLYRRLYERDPLGRLIYHQVDYKARRIDTTSTLWPEFAYRWTYDTDNRLLSSTLYENMNAQGLWIDSTVIERTYEFTSDPVPKVFRFTDSLEANGVKRPHLRHTYYYGNFALSSKVLYPKQKTHLYPNPTSETFFMEGVASLGQQPILGLYTALGQLIWQKSLNVTEGEILEIKLPSFAPGIYHVVIQGSVGQSSHRLIIK